MSILDTYFCWEKQILVLWQHSSIRAYLSIFIDRYQFSTEIYSCLPLTKKKYCVLFFNISKESKVNIAQCYIVSHKRILAFVFVYIFLTRNLKTRPGWNVNVTDKNVENLPTMHVMKVIHFLHYLTTLHLPQCILPCSSSFLF